MPKILDNLSIRISSSWKPNSSTSDKLPKGKEIPSLPRFKESKHHLKVKTLVDKYFDDHPGEIKDIWFPVNRNQAKLNLKIFLEERIESFGFYEDAMVSENNFLFHSTLSPSLNIGLIKYPIAASWTAFIETDLTKKNQFEDNNKAVDVK